MANQQLNAVLLHVRRLATLSGCPLSDRELLDRFVTSKDEGAFAALVQRHGPMVMNVCRRVLRNFQDAEDACQATFLLLVRKASSIRKRDSAASWLHGVAYRVARNLSREIGRRHVREQLVPHIPDCASMDNLTWREVQVALDQELNRLPERYQGPLVLCYLEGKTRDQAARHLGWSLGTLRGRLERGRKLLPSRMVRRGLTLSAALLGSAVAPQVTATVPTKFVTATVDAAMWMAAGKTLPGNLVSAQVLALTKGGLKIMGMTKVRMTALFLALGGALGAGAGGLTLATQNDAAALAQGTSPSPAAVNSGPAPAGDEEKAPRTIPELAVLTGSAAVLTVAFSPDGKLLAAGSSDGTITLWDIATGKEVRKLRSPAIGKVSIHSLKFSPDGKTLATADGHSAIKLLDVNTGRILGTLEGNQHTVLALAYAPDGKKLASSGADHAVQLWDVTSGKILWKFSSLAGRVASVAIAPDGQTLAAADEDGTVRILEVATGKEMHHIGPSSQPNASPPTAAVAISPDGRLLAVPGTDSVVILLEMASGKELRRFKNHGNWVTSVAFAPDGHVLASAGPDRTAKLWDVATGKQIAILKGHQDTVFSLAFSPDGTKLATGSADNTVKLWRLDGRKQVGPASPDDSPPPGSERLEALLDELVRNRKTAQESIDALFLATLARFPTESEMKFTQESLGKHEDRRAALKDLLFTLTNTKEYKAHSESIDKRLPPNKH